LIVVGFICFNSSRSYRFVDNDCIFYLFLTP
jgi:hypothetical protein